VIANSSSRGCGFRVNMWGTSSPGDKLTGDLANEPDATSISDRGLFCLLAGNLSAGVFRLLQQNRHKAALASAQPCPLPVEADIRAFGRHSGFDPNRLLAGPKSRTAASRDLLPIALRMIEQCNSTVKHRAGGEGEMRRPHSICEFQERSRPYVVIPLHGGDGRDNPWAFITITMPRKRNLFLGCRRTMPRKRNLFLGCHRRTSRFSSGSAPYSASSTSRPRICRTNCLRSWSN
jgi:hypothetical protein